MATAADATPSEVVETTTKQKGSTGKVEKQAQPSAAALNTIKKNKNNRRGANNSWGTTDRHTHHQQNYIGHKTQQGPQRRKARRKRKREGKVARSSPPTPPTANAATCRTAKVGVHLGHKVAELGGPRSARPVTPRPLERNDGLPRVHVPVR